MSVRGWGCYLLGGEARVAALAAERVLKAYSERGVQGVAEMYQSPPSADRIFEDAVREALKVQVSQLVNGLHHNTKKLIVRLAEIRCKQELGLP